MKGIVVFVLLFLFGVFLLSVSAKKGPLITDKVCTNYRALNLINFFFLLLSESSAILSEIVVKMKG